MDGSRRTPGLSSNRDAAIKFASCLRGQYIISKALAEAIEVMEQREGVDREPSDLQDMHYLHEFLFNFAVSQAKGREQFKKFVDDMNAKDEENSESSN